MPDRKNESRSVALVSGGLDSVVSLAAALEETSVRLVLFFDYAQRALERERDAVAGVVNFYDLPFREVDVSWLGEISPDGMRRDGAENPGALDSLDAVWIPNRNGVFLNVGAAYAERYDCDTLVTGFNREEAEEFPDNSAEYVTRANRAFEMSTRTGVRVRSFTQELSKPEILRYGAELGAPLSVIWSCYHGRSRMCGNCASCLRLKAALVEVGEGVRPRLEFEDDGEMRS